MMMNPLPDIDRAFSLVIQQERELNSSVTSLVSSNDSSELAMAMQVSSQQGIEDLIICTEHIFK
jgi:hypothetical protein